MIGFNSNDGEQIYSYNRKTKYKNWALEWHDGVITFYNYKTDFLWEWRYR